VCCSKIGAQDFTHRNSFVTSLRCVAVLQRVVVLQCGISHMTTHDNVACRMHTCNTLPHTATHCNTLQHTATHCNTLQHTATHCNTISHMTMWRVVCTPATQQHTSTPAHRHTTETNISLIHHNTLQHTVYGSTLQHTATHCRTPTTSLQTLHTKRTNIRLTHHITSLQHSATTTCNTLQQQPTRETHISLIHHKHTRVAQRHVTALQLSATHCNTLHHLRNTNAPERHTSASSTTSTRALPNGTCPRSEIGAKYLGVVTKICAPLSASRP